MLLVHKKKSPSQIVICLKPAYNEEEENELNSAVTLRKVWLGTFGIKVIKKQAVTAFPQKTTSVTFWIAEKCKNIIYEDKI